MNKKIIGVNLIKRLLICSVIGTLFVGCSTLNAGSKTNNNENQSAKQNLTSDRKDENIKPVSSGKVVQQKETLWDFRKTEESKTPKFSDAETKAVFTFLFGDKWDKELTISSKVSGSFTKPNAKETLYYVGGCDEGDGFRAIDNCAEYSKWNAGRIAIYDGTTPVMKTEAVLGSEIVKITDVNGNGINEILGFSGSTGQGYTEISAALGQIEDGKYKEIKSFSGSSDGCGTGIKSREFEKAAVISYVPTSNSKFPVFIEEYFQGKCDNPQWIKITKKQFDAQ